MIPTLLQVVPFIIALIFISIGIRRGKISKEEIGLIQPASWSVSAFWIGGFMLYAIFIECIMYHAGLLDITSWQYNLPIAILRALGAVILAPVVEEIIFRGVFLSFLQRKGMKAWLAIIIQAGAFMALHASVYENTITGNIAIAQIFTDAILFGMARHYTKSLFPSMTMHIFGNSIAIIERLL